VVLRDDNRLGIEGNVRAIRPDLVPGVPLINPRWSRDCPIGQNCEPYFNPAAFMRPAKGTLGDAPRTLDDARWPTTQFLDLSIQKNFHLEAGSGDCNCGSTPSTLCTIRCSRPAATSTTA
jgi:hypothetical protein